MRKLARVFFVPKVSTGVNTTATRCGTPPRWSLLSWTCELRWDFFPSVVFPWLLRSSVHTSAYIRRPRDTRRRGIMRERESIERQTGESRRELDIARSGLLLLRMKVHMSPLSRCLRCHSRCWCAKRSLIALLRYAVKGI